MMLQIKLFAIAMQKAGTTSLEIECSTPATIADIKEAALETCPALGNLLPYCRFAVDNEFATDATIVTEQSSLAIIPPVSGGT